MDTNLTIWQGRLEDHFRQLAAIKHEMPGSPPLFALEHTLDPIEVEELFGAIRKHSAHGRPLKEHTLPWIIYAAELGYRYAGYEYWQTFEQETPGWTAYGNRNWIRDQYRSFQHQYSGAEPSGAWARNFPIICWPITHAILPQDLQRQLAQILYDLRHAFSSELLENPALLGEVIQARSFNARSRFQTFVQRTELVGQIAAALLFQGQFGTDSLIYGPTLERISKDLNRERLARDWLSSARRVAQEHARVRGLSVGGRSPRENKRSEELRDKIDALGIEPRLLMRPLEATGTSWQVLLEIPDLSHLLLKFPHLYEILTNTRCRVAGSTGRPLARGRCLHGKQRIVLSSWPNPTEVLLQFEQRDLQLEYLLSTECLLRPGPAWLFRIASDGIAYEMRSIRARPGEQYILATTNGPLESTNHVYPIDLHCEEVFGALLDLPAALTEEWQDTLGRLGVGQAKTIEVWPAGLDAATWDGEGHGEWVTSENPCLAILSDHSLDSILITLPEIQEPTLEIKPVMPGEPVFIEFPDLPVGLHKVHVAARKSGDADSEDLGNLDVVMRIREMRSWAPGISPQGPLRVQIDPLVPTLEELWEGKVSITLQGPLRRSAKCHISLFERDENNLILEKQLPPIPLPMSPDEWKSHFEKNFRKKRQVEEVYDVADICQLQFTAEELGAFSIRCDREFTPLRWTVRRHDDDRVLCLLDDSGEEEQPSVSHLSFEAPCVEEKLGPQSEYAVPNAGGLYIARGSQTIASVIIPPVVRNLRDLECIPHIHNESRSADAVYQLLMQTHLWGQAKGTGDFISIYWQQKVLLALLHEIIDLICGESWARTEEGLRDDPLMLSRLQRVISNREYWAGIGEVLRNNVTSFSQMRCEERVKTFASIAIQYRLLSNREAVESVSWLSELALRITSDPANVQSWAGERLQQGLGRLMETSTMLRAARFLVLLIDVHFESNVRPGELFAGWRWI